jgi:large subunit ribosomal protein L24
MKIKKGDHIIVLAGKDKGKKGKVVRSFPKRNKVVVEGINVVKKNQRPKKSGEKGQIISMAMPLHISNVAIVDPKTGKASRIGKKEVDGKMVRISKKSNQEI